MRYFIVIIACIFVIGLVLFSELEKEEKGVLETNNTNVTAFATSSIKIEYSRKSLLEESSSSEDNQSQQNLISFSQDTTNQYEILVIANDPAYEKPSFSKDVLIEGNIKGAGRYIIKIPKNILESSGFMVQIIDLDTKKRVFQFDDKFFRDIFEGDKRVVLNLDPFNPAQSRLQIEKKEKILPIP